MTEGALVAIALSPAGQMFRGQNKLHKISYTMAPDDFTPISTTGAAPPCHAFAAPAKARLTARANISITAPRRISGIFAPAATI
jgi:hypothetical protein